MPSLIKSVSISPDQTHGVYIGNCGCKVTIKIGAPVGEALDEIVQHDGQINHCCPLLFIEIVDDLVVKMKEYYGQTA